MDHMNDYTDSDPNQGIGAYYITPPETDQNQENRIRLSIASTFTPLYFINLYVLDLE